MTVGVALMTYGAPAGDDDLPRYLAHIRGGKEPAPELIVEMRRRYAAIGGSPLVSITQAQAVCLGELLGEEYRVVAGMRFSEPSVASAVRELAACERIVGLCLSPQWSPTLMGGYERALAQAVASHAPRASTAMIGAWHRTPQLIAVFADRIRTALASLPETTPVLLTAHSLPRRVFDAEPDYLAQLHETAELVAAQAGLSEGKWRWSYQSAGHTAEEWLRPDLSDIFPALAAEGHRAVLVAPIQFLADHLEVLYDLDIAARAQAEAAGLAYHRIEMPNTDSEFIAALAAVVRAA